MNRSEYISKLEHEMNNSDSYETTESDLTQDSLKSVRKLANKMLRDGEISKDMHQYLVPWYPKAG